MATWLVRKAQDEGGLGRVSPGFLGRSAGVTFQRFGWVLRPAPPDSRGCGRVGRACPAGLSRRAKGLWVRGYAHYSRRLRRLPGRPVRGGQSSAMFLIDRDLRPCTSSSRPGPGTGNPLLRPRGERDATSPQKWPLRASEPGGPRFTHVVTTYQKYTTEPAEPASFCSRNLVEWCWHCWHPHRECHPLRGPSGR